MGLFFETLGILLHYLLTIFLIVHVLIGEDFGMVVEVEQESTAGGGGQVSGFLAFGGFEGGVGSVEEKLLDHLGGVVAASHLQRRPVQLTLHIDLSRVVKTQYLDYHM